MPAASQAAHMAAAFVAGGHRAMPQSPPPAPELLAAAPCSRAMSTSRPNWGVSMVMPLVRARPSKSRRLCPIRSMTPRESSSSIARIRRSRQASLPRRKSA